MIKVGITGSWRKTCPELDRDLKREVASLLDDGKAIVTGGALNVDYKVTELALEYEPDGSRINVYLPTTLDIYAAHYRNRANEGVITSAQAEALIKQLEVVNSVGSLIVDKDQSTVDQHSYYLRNTAVMSASDELLAFQVNASAGTQDTIDKSRDRGIPVKVFTYQVD